MRHFSAILLLTLIALSLLTPAFGAEADAVLPACCRRAGAHRCSMGPRVSASPVAENTSSPAPALRSNRKCPLYTGFTSTPAHAVIGFAEPARADCLDFIHADILRRQGEVARVVSIARAHAKRGPPAASPRSLS